MIKITILKYRLPFPLGVTDNLSMIAFSTDQSTTTALFQLTRTPDISTEAAFTNDMAVIWLQL